MRILYVAKHCSGGNDDEGAIAYALRKLGHEVLCYGEGVHIPSRAIPRADFCLFHKWQEYRGMQTVAKVMPLVCWYFDLVDYPDPTLASRNEQRREYMTRVASIAKHVFCTDGDWASVNGLHHLPQGADERYVGLDEPKYVDRPILMTASKKGGRGRDAFIDTMLATYGDELKWHPRGLHGRQLRQAVASASVVVAPREPCTAKYWSNRVYLTLGFGGTLLHPFSVGLGEHFQHMIHYVTYGDDRDLVDKMKYVRSWDYERRLQMRLQALEAIRREHLYRHRCEEMLRCLNLS